MHHCSCYCLVGLALCLPVALSGCADATRAVDAGAIVASDAVPAPLSADAVVSRTGGHVDVMSMRYDIDRIYKSMTGPSSRQPVQMLEGPPELVWITGAHVRMADGDGRRPMPDYFMCHTNLDMDVEKHRSIFHFQGDRSGRHFTGHWLVTPGREENHTQVTTMMDLAADTTIHFIGAHLHPFAESVALRDLTTDETIFRGTARNLDEQLGLAEVQWFSSVEGVPVFANHEYEIVSVYNNTSGQNQDAMAALYLYVLDPEFKKPLGEQQTGR
jgi:hypothetical protein